MALVAECPSCGKKLKVPDNLLGKQVRCADCAGTFVAETPRPAPEAPAASSHVRDEVLDDDRDKRRSRRKADYEPHRGGMILAFGIISLVSTLFLPIIVGLPLGIMAWVMGGKDLKRISAGRMDPEGRSTTQTGYILGIIGTILHSLALVGICLYVLFVVVIVGIFLGAAASNLPTTPAGRPGIPNPPRPPALPRPPRSSLTCQPMGLPSYLPRRLV